MHLWQKSKTQKYQEITKCQSPALGKVYEEDKVHSHIAVLIGMILYDKSMGHLTLKEMRRQLHVLYDNLQLKKKEQNNTLIELCLNTIGKTKDCNSEQIKTLHQDFMREIYPLLETYKHNAASVQLHGLHDIISRWQKEYNLDLLSSKIIVVGCKRPRNGMIEMQYFEYLYKELGLVNVQINNHLMYEEVSHEMMKTIKIKNLINDLGVHAYNKKIRAMMGEDYPVDEADILKDEAPKICPYLSKNTLVQYSLFNNNKKVDIENSELLKQSNRC